MDIFDSFCNLIFQRGKDNIFIAEKIFTFHLLSENKFSPIRFA
jgi:hypothetical protein